ncbi:MAG: sigma-70 family RNA polymerase sigma factor [Clostridia bacterium]|nr:sigma-70 family RNA polymerase sigma factor [Clostridia bacterium]
MTERERLAKQSDESLVELSQNGDKQATELLLLRHSGLVRGCARRFFLVGGETEDLIQEGMIGLYNAIGDYRKKEDGRSFKNFAYLCVSRRIIDAVKSTARKKNAALNFSVSTEDGDWATDELSPEDMLILNDDKREFQQKMSKVLSDFEFKIISMYIEGMTCAEICAATGKSAKSVDNAIQRSKKKLQQILKA